MLLSLASGADPTSIYRPDAATALKLRVTNWRSTPDFTGWTIEPYRAGAVVTGKLTQGAEMEGQQLTLFCRTNAPGKVFLMASWQYRSAAPGQAAEDNAAIRTYINGSAVSVGGKMVRRGQGYDNIADAHVDNADRWFLTYALDASEFSAGLSSGKLQLDIDGPHFLGMPTFEPPTAGLAATTRIAFKSCL
jgi:hypothetical protein